MTENDANLWVKRTYWLTSSFGILGFVWYLAVAGWQNAIAFALGAATSFGNLWVFDRLTHTLAPGAASRKPWEAGVYFIRYILLLGIGYGIVKLLGVNPLALILGLFASAAAVLTSILLELFQTRLGTRPKH